MNVTHLKILEASFKANGGDYKQLLVDARTQAEAEILAQKEEEAEAQRLAREWKPKTWDELKDED